MKAQRQFFLLIFSLALMTLLSTASAAQVFPQAAKEPGEDMLTLIGNPAAVYCQTLMGYDYEVTTADDGSQTGICTMPDGETCEQWDFYDGTCGADYSYCQQQGYNLRTEENGADPFASTYSVCYDPETRDSFPISNLIAEESTCDASAQDAQFMLPPLDEAAQTNQAAPGEVGLPQAPSSFDWRSVNGSNWLTGVKNQASCGGCWSFATMGVVEGSNNILNNDPTLDQNLSEQLMISTCPTYGEPGDCNGGHAYMALNIAASDGVVDEACMPFLVSNSDCSTRCSDWADRLSYAKNSVWGYLTLTPAKLKEYISRHGPVTVYMGINAAFGGHWDGDIYRCTDDSSINHAVVAVGYNDAEQYWIIRNSWGSTWNGDGYFKVGYGECMIDSYLYSFVDTKPPDSSHSLSGTLGENGWYTSDITVNISSSDPYGSGLAYMEHHLNSASWTKVYSTSTSITVSTDGAHTFYYRAKDHGGNLEATHAVAVKRDTASPTNPSTVTETACGATSGVEINCTDPTFSWNAGTDAASGVQGYGVYFGTSSSGTDNSSFITTLSHDPGTLTAGTYYLRLRTKDMAGHWSGWATQFTLIISDTGGPPVTTHNLSGTLGENGWYTSDITIDLSATPAEGQTIDYIEYHFNSDAWTQVQSSTTSTSLTNDGTHSFSYRAADDAGSLETTHTITLKRDAASPTNPGSVIETACGATSGVSTSCTDPAFSWNAGSDATSGVQGYGVYFGTDSSGTDSSSLITTLGHDPGTLSPGTYYLRLRTKDNAGNWSGWATQFTLIVDSTAPPVTTHNLSGTLGENDWYTADITITLNATTSGGNTIDYIEYHFNSDAWTQVHSSSTSTTLTHDGTHSFAYRAADDAGNLETTHTITLKRDATQPTNPATVTETACGATSGVSTSCTDPAFSWNAGSDAASGVQGYGVYFGTDSSGTDSGSFIATLGHDPAALAPGTYYLRLRTKDNAGNWSGWATKFTLIIDSGEAPVTTHTLNGTLGENDWYTSDIAIALNATPASGHSIDYIEYHFNGDAWTQVHSSSTSTNHTADGIASFYYRAADDVGNLETTHAITLKRDATNPLNTNSASETACGALSGTATTCSDPAFSWPAGSDATSGVQGYGLYFGANPTGTDSNAFTTLRTFDPGPVSSGTYYLRLRTKDNAGNWSDWATRFTLIVDAGDAPVTTYNLYGTLGQNGWYVSDITAALNATAASGKTISYIEYQLNSSGWNKVYSSSANASITSDGQHTFSFHAVDNVGTAETIQTVTLKRDVTLPTNPETAFETNCGAANGVTTTCTYPTFMWTAGSDATSGIQGYGVYFGNDPNGTSDGYFTNGQYHEPGNVSPGTYYLRLRTRDNAGNWSAWVTKFVFDSRTSAPGQVYLPLVTLSPAPVIPLNNGGFEAGSDGSWDVFSSHGWPLIYEFAGGGTHGGTWLAWLGDDANETSRLSQTATVPTASPYLHYWYMIYSDDECGYDFAAVKVNGSTFRLTSLCDSTTTLTWTEVIIDLSIYQGQTVTITFEVTTDGLVHSSYYLDDVAFGSSQSAAPAHETPDARPPAWIGQHKTDFE